MARENSNVFETSIKYQVIANCNYTSHNFRQRTIDFQHHLYKQNCTAIKDTNRCQHGKQSKRVQVQKASNFLYVKDLLPRQNNSSTNN